MTEPYHNEKMVTVNETAYKSVKENTNHRNCEHMRAPCARASL